MTFTFFCHYITTSFCHLNIFSCFYLFSPSVLSLSFSLLSFFFERGALDGGWGHAINMLTRFVFFMCFPSISQRVFSNRHDNFLFLSLMERERAKEETLGAVKTLRLREFHQWINGKIHLFASTLTGSATHQRNEREERSRKTVYTENHTQISCDPCDIRPSLKIIYAQNQKKNKHASNILF